MKNIKELVEDLEKYVRVESIPIVDKIEEVPEDSNGKALEFKYPTTDKDDVVMGFVKVEDMRQGIMYILSLITGDGMKTFIFDPPDAGSVGQNVKKLLDRKNVYTTHMDLDAFRSELYPLTASPTIMLDEMVDRRVRLRELSRMYRNVRGGNIGTTLERATERLFALYNIYLLNKINVKNISNKKFKVSVKI
jgi:hypothetical protein